VAAFVREPVRGGLDPPAVGAVGAGEKAPFWPTCRKFFAHPVLRRVSIATAITQVVTYGSLNFTTLLLMREKGMTLRDVAAWYALVLAVAVSAGMYTSGRMIDCLAPRTKRAYAYLPAGALAIALPFFIGFVMAPGWRLALLFLAVPLFLNYFYLSPSVALVQDTVRPQERVLAGALLLLVMNLVGLGLGPTLLGAVSDALKPGHPEHSLQLAFYALVPFYVLAVLCFLWLARAFRPDARNECVRK
jgi:MFS family permease